MEEYQLPYFIKTNANGSGLNKTVMNKAIKILMANNERYIPKGSIWAYYRYTW